MNKVSLFLLFLVYNQNNNTAYATTNALLIIKTKHFRPLVDLQCSPMPHVSAVINPERDGTWVFKDDNSSVLDAKVAVQYLAATDIYTIKL